MRAAIFGANGGIGRALCRKLLEDQDTETLYGVARALAPDSIDPRFVPIHGDLTNDDGLRRKAEMIRQSGPLDLVIVASGLLSDGEGLVPEKSWRDQSLGAFERVFAANTFGPALVAKHFLPILRRRSPSKFAVLSARVGSISDNGLGGWHAYRASKAALNMLVKNYALELARRNDEAVCIGLHPGTVSTRLSAPFVEGTKRKVFTPDEAAGQLLNVLNRVTPEDSGKQLDWSGKEIPA